MPSTTDDTATTDHTATDPAVAEPADRPEDIAAAMQTPAFRRDPYPLYARMRRTCPVYRSPQGIWYLTRYADVETALSDPRLSNDRDRMTRALSARDGGMRGLSRLIGRLGRIMTNTDPPEHARLRKLVNKAFTARRVEGLRDRIQMAVDELVRYDPPTQVIIRVAADDLPVGGEILRTGDLVYLVLAATNRDPDRFTDPDRLDLMRRGNRHLSFGNGPHFCLGAPPARLEAEPAIGTLVRKLPTLRLDDTRALEWRPNPLQRRLRALPLAY
ncbi:cytochrome P450 [Streptomyces sp. NPDC053427]|uniref:cytochrome P450 n=1 Tax=Streptomyces sp. NPDC053427 TaxID=3365701 RepID=UPI0037D723AA